MLKSGTYYCNPKLNKLGTCRSFQPRQSFEKFSILAFYAEKEITVMTNIKVLLKSCDHMNLNGHTSVFHPQTQESKINVKKVLLKRSHLNGHTSGFSLQTDE